ncbi:unnamed protein product [Orchesella dallaii]|uniref:Cytochrome b561 domain-containing protein n=1 Tax=Orchesella dallaii TaxID=48710 RepID=A0ABP1QSH7_9HEXA
MADEDNGKLGFKLFALGSLAVNVVNMLLVIFVVVWVYQGGGFGSSATHPHAVMMVIAMILYGSITGGALAFLLPQTPWSIRLAAKPYHKGLGVVIFNLAGITSITGILITITYGLLARLKNPSKSNGYSARSVEIVTFMIPVLISISCTITTYLILETSFRRQPPVVFQAAITPQELLKEEDDTAINATSGEPNPSKDNLGNKVEESDNVQV